MARISKRENKKGIHYQVTIRKKGYKTVTRTFEKKSQAISWANKIETQMNEGTYKENPDVVIESGEKLIRMSDLINHYKNNIAPVKYSYSDKYTVMYDWWIDKIGNIKIKELSASMLASCKRILMSEKIYRKSGETVRSNNTINKYLMALSAILTYAVKELEIIDINPMSKVSIMPKPNGRTRFLSLDEIELLLNACKNHSDMLYLFVMIALSTGGRYSEVLNLQIKDIDFQNNQLFYLDTKNKTNRGVPVNADLIGLIKDYAQKNSIDDYIFINKSSGKLYYIREALQKIIKDIGLKDFHIHDIRHTTASYIAMNGGSLLDIAEILGHKSLVMARRYSHLTQKHTASVLNKVTDKIIPNID